MRGDGGRLRGKVAALEAELQASKEECSALQRALRAAHALETPDEGPESGERAVRIIRKPVLPAYSHRATRSARDLPARIVREMLLAVAGLAAGDEAPWRGTKQLVRPDGAAYSAHVGIHYRIIFRVHDGALDVIDLIHRRDLERMVHKT